MLLNDTQPQRFWKFLIYADSGSGKTHLGVSAPDPVILLGERQGFETVRDAAKRFKKPMPPTFWIQKKQDLIDAMRILATDAVPVAGLIKHFAPDEETAKRQIAALPYTAPKTVVFDSMTEFANQIFDSLTEEAPPKMAKDGLPDISMRYWGAYKERVSRFIRAARDLPYHCVFLALKDDKEVGDGDEKSRVICPMMLGRATPAMLEGATNAVGTINITRKYVTKKKGDEEVRQQKLIRSVQFTGPSFMHTKPLAPLEDTEVPSIEDWIKRLNAQGEEEQSPATKTKKNTTTKKTSKTEKKETDNV